MPSWDEAVASPEQQRELKRRAILRVASRLFNEKGFHGTSLDEIADVLGVTKTALYYYVKNKDALLYECMVLSYRCGGRAREYAESRARDPREEICMFYGRFVELLVTERGAYTTMANINALPEERRTELLERRRGLSRYLRTKLREAAEQGLIWPVDPRITANFLLGAANWVLRWYGEDDKQSPAEIASVFVDLLLNGVAAGNPVALPPFPGEPGPPT